MADSNFTVKNTLVVNASFAANSSGVYFSNNLAVNSSFFTGTANIALNSNNSLSANNANNLGGVAAASYVNTSGNYTLSGNLNLTGANVVFGSGWKIGANVIADTTAIRIGNTVQNAVINSTGLFINNQPFDGGGGYYKGNLGPKGNTNNAQNLFRINANTQSNNITISTGENALTAGPIAVGLGFTFTVETGGRAVII
jgi:hypothetical protein